MAIDKKTIKPVRVNENEHDFIAKKAEAAGFAWSTYVRELALENIPQDTEKFSKYDLTKELKEFRKEILSLGNNLNQIARVANTTGSVDPARVEDIRSMLIDLTNRVQKRI